MPRVHFYSSTDAVIFIAAPVFNTNGAYGGPSLYSSRIIAGGVISFLDIQVDIFTWTFSIVVKHRLEMVLSVTLEVACDVLQFTNEVATIRRIIN